MWRDVNPVVLCILVTTKLQWTSMQCQSCPCCLQERLSDVLKAVADSILGLRSAADSNMLSLLRTRVECLKVFVLDLDPSITPAVYASINACVREFS